MKKTMVLLALLIALPYGMAFSKDANSGEKDSCGWRSDLSRSVYDCAMNPLANRFPEGWERDMWSSVVFKKAREGYELAKALIENRMADFAKALNQGQNPNVLFWSDNWCAPGNSPQDLYPCHSSMTLFDFAAFIGNTEAVKLLLSSPRLSVNAEVGDSHDAYQLRPENEPLKEAELCPALAEAVGKNRIEIVKMLLLNPRVKLSNNINVPTVFHAAVGGGPGFEGSAEVLKLLLADGRLDPNHREPLDHLYALDSNIYGERERDTTPLMFAAMKARPQMIQLLLQDPRVRQGMRLKARSGRTALEIAKHGLRKMGRESDSNPLKQAYKDCVRLLQTVRSTIK